MRLPWCVHVASAMLLVSSDSNGAFVMPLCTEGARDLKRQFGVEAQFPILLPPLSVVYRTIGYIMWD